MADILSQEEIDRLLTVSGPEPSAEVSELSADEVEAVEGVTRLLVASANSAFAALLAQPASVREGLGQVVQISALDTGRAVLTRFPFRSGVAGEILFHLQHEEASILADLILGGEGASKEALEETDLDALREAMSQIAGSSSPSLSSALGCEVGFDAPTLTVVERGRLAEELSWGNAFLGVGTIKVDGILDTPFRILLSVNLARDMAQLLRGGEEPDAAVTLSPHPAATAVGDARATTPVSSEIRNIDLILDIEVEVMVRLGEAVMPLRDIQRLRPGSIIDLDKDTDATVDLVVNDRVIARGELVVVGSDHFALRITEIETPVERIRKLGPS